MQYAVKQKDVWYKENIMASSCGKKKYEEGGKVDKSKGVTGRTSKKAKDDQKMFQQGYRDGLKDGVRQFNLKGKEALKDKPASTKKMNKLGKGHSKGVSDMKDALKGQGAFKKGGKVKYCKDGCAIRGKTKGRMV